MKIRITPWFEFEGEIDEWSAAFVIPIALLIVSIVFSITVLS